MWPYILLIGIPLVLQHTKVANNVFSLEPGNNTNNKRALFWFWIMLFIMVAFRHESIGNDTLVYKYIFHTIEKSDWLTALGRSPEIGYSFMNKIISVFTDEFRLVLIICAFLAIYQIAKTYVEFSTDAALTLSLFIIISNFVLLFSGLRQAIAISLGFLAFAFVRNKKIIPFVIVTVIAILFHTSAFMIAFMYPLYHIKLRRKMLVFIIPALIVFYVFNRQIFTFLGWILTQFSDYNTSINETGSVTMLILFILFSAFSYIVPDELKLDADTIGMRNFLLLSVAIQMFAPLHTLAMRMNYYYIAFIPILIPKIIDSRSDRMAQVAIVARHIMVVFFIAYFFITAPSDNVLHTFPYKFMWENT